MGDKKEFQRRERFSRRFSLSKKREEKIRKRKKLFKRKKKNITGLLDKTTRDVRKNIIEGGR